MRGNEFIKESTLKNKKIGYEITPDETPGSLQYSSDIGVSIAFKTSGDLPPIAGSSLTKADAGAIIEFKDRSGIVFRANGVLNPYIDDQDALGKKIIEKFNDGKWDKDWVVITEIMKARSAVIIISNNGGGKIELKATGKINAANIDIADASAKFTVANSENIHTQIIASKGITPLFKVKGIKKKVLGLWGDPTFKSVSKAMGIPPGEMPKKAEKKLVEVPVFGDVEFIK
jgi:hypothetical protein